MRPATHSCPCIAWQLRFSAGQQTVRTTQQHGDRVHFTSLSKCIAQEAWLGSSRKIANLDSSRSLIKRSYRRPKTNSWEKPPSMNYAPSLFGYKLVMPLWRWERKSQIWEDITWQHSKWVITLVFRKRNATTAKSSRQFCEHARDFSSKRLGSLDEELCQVLRWGTRVARKKHTWLDVGVHIGSQVVLTGQFNERVEGFLHHPYTSSTAMKIVSKSSFFIAEISNFHVPLQHVVSKQFVCKTLALFFFPIAIREIDTVFMKSHLLSPTVVSK